MKKLLVLALSILGAAVASGGSDREAPRRAPVTLTKAALLDKIKGGWAGQVIGCTFGGPTEFAFNSTFIPLHQPISWTSGAVQWCFENQPGLYDDVYMDLTFVEVLEKSGLDAPAAAFAEKFAHAPYPLWHANQMARYNILNGLGPPQSGHWLNNPHADDIDFQIEADFAGLMSPGLAGAAAGVCDRVGHIMNSGDGYYGGLFVAVMYSLAFVESDIHRVVERAIAAVPAETSFARTVRTVIDGHRLYPADWLRTWFEVQRLWGADIGCPEGVFRPFNIDARMNAAWAVLGLLYGDGDFGRTIEVSVRAGDDSDCNPATAGGILGALLGLDKIPERWKAGLEAIRDRDFPFTGLSLEEASQLSFKHALEMIKRRGGSVDGQTVRIPVEEPSPAPLEVGFEGHFPVERRRLAVTLSADSPETAFEFDGIGFVVNEGAAPGRAPRRASGKSDDLELIAEIRVDDAAAEILRLPLSDRFRRPTPFWKYRLPPAKHLVRLSLRTPSAGGELRLIDAIVYGDKPREHSN